MLIVFSGLPGTGKTTIGKALVAKRSAVYIRVDEIEHALRRYWGSAHDIGAAGYEVAFAIASSNLKLGSMVVADSVNPVPESRQGWRNVAQATEGKRLLEVEIICSDKDEHKRRVEQRVTDICGFKVPTWLSVMSHDYVPWTEPRLTLDTALLDTADAVALIDGRIEEMINDCPSSP